MKNAKPKNQEIINRQPSIKFVKAAKMWAKTTWENGKQKIEWFKDKPTL